MTEELEITKGELMLEELKDKIEVRFVDYGVANNYGDLVEFHQDLQYYPHLFEPLIKHEFAHSDTPGFTIYDFKHDVKPSGVPVIQLLKFMLTRPRTFWQFAPFYWHKEKGFVWDLNLAIMYVSILIVGGIAAVLIL